MPPNRRDRPAEPTDHLPAPLPGTLDELLLSGIVRSDIRSNFAGGRPSVTGVPLRVHLTVLDARTGAPRPGQAVCLWHCDRLGRYARYSSGVHGENLLRGLQISDPAGRVRFTTIFPAATAGRPPHLNVDVYAGLSRAVDVAHAARSLRIDLPAAACAAVLASPGYGDGRHAAPAPVVDDVRRDSDATAPTMSGGLASGYELSATIALAG